MDNRQPRDDVWSRMKKPNRSVPSSPRQQKRTTVRSSTTSRYNSDRRPKNSVNPGRPLDKTNRISLIALKRSNKAVSGHIADTVHKATRRLYANKKTTIIALSSVLIIGVGVFALQTTTGSNSDASDPQSLGLTDGGNLNSSNAVPVQEVSFNPFFPFDFEARGIEFALQKRNENDFAIYTDSLSGVEFGVTQQALPESLSSGEVEQVESLAKALPLPADQRAQVDRTTFFLSGPAESEQTVVFSKNNVLVIISANGYISEAVWALYIASLVQ